MEYPLPRGGRYANNFAYSLEFRSESPDGIIFFVAGDTGQYVIVYLRNGKVSFLETLPVGKEDITNFVKHLFIMKSGKKLLDSLCFQSNLFANCFIIL